MEYATGMQRGVSKVLVNQGHAEINSNKRHLLTQRRLGYLMFAVMCLGTISAVVYLSNQNNALKRQISASHKLVEKQLEYWELSDTGKVAALQDEINCVLKTLPKKRQELYKGYIEELRKQVESHDPQ